MEARTPIADHMCTQSTKHRRVQPLPFHIASTVIDTAAHPQTNRSGMLLPVVRSLSPRISHTVLTGSAPLPCPWVFVVGVTGMTREKYQINYAAPDSTALQRINYWSRGNRGYWTKTSIAVESIANHAAEVPPSTTINQI